MTTLPKILVMFGKEIRGNVSVFLFSSPLIQVARENQLGKFISVLDKGTLHCPRDKMNFTLQSAPPAGKLPPWLQLTTPGHYYHFDESQQMLQRRSSARYPWGSLWTTASCLWFLTLVAPIMWFSQGKFTSSLWRSKLSSRIHISLISLF